MFPSLYSEPSDQSVFDYRRDIKTDHPFRAKGVGLLRVIIDLNTEFSRPASDNLHFSASDINRNGLLVFPPDIIASGGGRSCQYRYSRSINVRKRGGRGKQTAPLCHVYVTGPRSFDQGKTRGSEITGRYMMLSASTIVFL